MHKEPWMQDHQNAGALLMAESTVFRIDQSDSGLEAAQNQMINPRPPRRFRVCIPGMSFSVAFALDELASHRIDVELKRDERGMDTR